MLNQSQIELWYEDTWQYITKDMPTNTRITIEYAIAVWECVFNQNYENTISQGK